MDNRERHGPTTERRRLLSMRQVEQITGLSRTTLWRLAQAGQFPKAVQISAGRTAFFVEDIENWLTSKREASA